MLPTRVPAYRMQLDCTLNAIYSHDMTNTIGRSSRASVAANVAQIIARESEDTDATPVEE